MSLSDRIAVMDAGRIEQIGTPAEIYESPRTSFVAAFIGDTNFLEGEVTAVEGEYCCVRIPGFPEVSCFNDKGLQSGNLVYLSIRPEKIQISRDRPLTNTRDVNAIPAKVEDVIYLGSNTKYWVRRDSHRVQVMRQHFRFFLDEKPIRWKDDVWIWWSSDDGFMLERFRRDDEKLMSLPPQKVGEQ
jgi:spermidine/putrescine transport system ATP-binding protein